LELSEVEKQVASIQQKLIWHRGSIVKYISNENVKFYAAELAAHYFPKRADSPIYLAPVAHAYAVDLTLAPILHRTHHLWRYDYDNLDIVSQFYKFTTPSKEYYHLAHGKLPTITVDDVRYGCEILRIDLGEHIEVLFDTYYVEGARARVAARVLEALAGLQFDYQLNKEYGFLETESHKQLRKMEGKGRFRYLRRGREWMALGTAEMAETIDLRKEPARNFFGYRIELQNKRVRISLSKQEVDQAKAEILAILESESSIVWRVKKVNSFYENFHKRHRYINAFSWSGLDHWVQTRVAQAGRTSEQKRDWQVYQASKHKKPATNQPRRGNFFWDIKKSLNFGYQELWNPYRWPQPER
jgi:hypothetical protein